MELEELKKGWKMMDKQMDTLESENEAPVSRITQNRAVSSQQRLIREFQMMTSICLMTPFWIVMIQRNVEGFPDWTVYMFFVFFMVMAAHKGFIWWKLARLDYKRMTVKEALIATYKLEKYQKTGILFGISLAVPVLVCFIVELYLLHEVYALYGAFCGLLIGLYIGFRVRRRIKGEIKAMREALDDELD